MDDLEKVKKKRSYHSQNVTKLVNKVEGWLTQGAASADGKKLQHYQCES